MMMYYDADSRLRKWPWWFSSNINFDETVFIALLTCSLASRLVKVIFNSSVVDGRKVSGIATNA